MGLWDWFNSASDTVKNHTPAITLATEFFQKGYYFCRDSTVYAAGTVSSKARDLHEYLSDNQARENLTQIAKNVSKNGAFYVARSYGGGPIIDIITRSVQENKSDSQKERLKELEHKVAKLEKELISRNMAEQSKVSMMTVASKSQNDSNFNANINEKPEDLLKLFMMEQFVGIKLFNNLIIPTGVSKERPVSSLDEH
ncbi:uncharacterized protein LOC130804065 [Amaranthus tricolor]|uniref:uncharacterized protein LOC130804065 n=1 Tax=Amaranthus tricolor TaxID=29722 RepID=UPI0025852407|nr:uncharacterized protein LOC130804065 [Amaranthus tricolor]